MDAQPDDLSSERAKQNLQNSVASFSLQVQRLMGDNQQIAMGSVWNLFVSTVLSKNSGMMKLQNLILRSQDIPEESASCTLSVLSYWSSIDKCQSFYSKLERYTDILSKLPVVSYATNLSKILQEPNLPSKSCLNELGHQRSKSMMGIDDIEGKEPEIHNGTGLIDTPHNQKENIELKPQAHPLRSEELISVVVHDMRSPLMCIQGNLELLDFEINKLPNYALMQPLIKSSITSAALLETLVSDILDAARIAKGIFKVEIQKFNIEQSIQECLDIIGLAASARQNSLQLKIDADSNNFIYSDKHRIKQVMLNFLSNSVKFTQGGEITVQVEEQIHTKRITVKDTGSGISKDILPTLFEKFTSDRRNRNSKGIGLGLFICKSIILTIGPKQEIHVISEPGKGTSFSFQIYKNCRKDIVQGKSPARRSQNEFLSGSQNTTRPNGSDSASSQNKSSVDIFTLSNLVTQQSRRLIQCKMKWDVTWTQFHNQPQLIPTRPASQDRYQKPDTPPPILFEISPGVHLKLMNS